MRNDRKQLVDKLPCDLDAERLLLGVLLIGHEKSGEIYEYIVPEDFFDTRHQIIYKTMREMWEKNLPTELPLVYGNLGSTIEAAGGASYLGTLVDGIPFRTQVTPYLASLKTKRVLREAATLARYFEEAAFDADKTGLPASELIDSFLEKLAGIGKMAESEDRGTTYKDAAASELFKLDDQQQIRVLTGLKTIDETTGGFRSGELIVLTAETGVGKSFMGLQIGKCACAAGHHVLYCSGEMLAEHLMGRVLSSESGIEYWKIRRPEKLEQAERMELLRAASVQCTKCRILDKELTLGRIRMCARSMASNHELGLVIVDYDELVEVRGKDEWEQQRILVRSLKSLSMELGIPVIMVSQLRKTADKDDRKHPTLQRLYGSGAKIKHASIVLHVDRPFVRELKGDEAEAKILILKSRDGRMGMVECKFNVRTLRFEE